MIRINMAAPKGTWVQFEKWRGLYTILYRAKGQMWHTVIQIHLWGLGNKGSKSYYTAKKVQPVIHFQEN